MLIKVIYLDGTLGTVKSSNIDKLVKYHHIAAYQCSEGWVEVRRKKLNIDYKGLERRKRNQESIRLKSHQYWLL